MSFLRTLPSLVGMFQCLLGMFVSGLVIFLPVVRGGCTVRVSGEFVEFRGSLVQVTGHSLSYFEIRFILESWSWLSCSILNTSAAARLFRI